MSFGFTVTPSWFSGFDHFTYDDTMFASAQGYGAGPLTAAGGWRGPSVGRSLHFNSVGQCVQPAYRGHTNSLDDSSNYNITGVYMRLGTVGGSLPAAGISLISDGDFVDGFGAPVHLSRAIVLGANGSLEVWRKFDIAGSRVKLTNTANNVLPAPGTWFKLEVESRAASTSTSNNGLLNILIDGTSVLSVGTLPDEATTLWRMVLGPYATNGAGTGVDVSIDDCYHLRQASSMPVAITDFLGSWAVERLRTRADGNYSTLNLGAGSSHWGAVSDDAENDGYSTYVGWTSGGGFPKRDTYAYQPMPSVSGTPLSVMALLSLRNDQGGPYSQNNWVEGEDATHFNPSAMYPERDIATTARWVYGKRHMQVHPVTAAAWTRSAVNALLMGPYALNNNIEATQALLEVLVQNPVYARPQSRIAIIG